MTISEIIEQLQAIKDTNGDLPVMFKDGASDDVWELSTVIHKIAEKGEYPEDWGLDNYEFVLVGQ